MSGLQQQDFLVLDNKAKQTLTSFRPMDGRETQIEVLVVVDAVNVGQHDVAYVRDQIEKFLLTDGGHLAYPTTVAVFTDTGTDIQEGLTDGNALSASLEKSTIGHRYLGGSSASYGAAERFQLSLNALIDLAAREASRPGRKIILWVSPGWPLLSAPDTGVGTKQQQQLFAGVVSLSSTLLQGRITLYSIDPLGTTTDAASMPTFYWKDFLKGISKPNQVLPGNLALEVIATQSGGVAISSSNDVARSLRECLADTHAYYELTFDPPVSDQPDEYHHLEVHVAKRGLIPRTRQGYYSQAGRAQSGAVEPEKPSKAGDRALPRSPSTASEGANSPSSFASEHPYIDLPLAELVERVPELKPLQPAPDQTELGMILQKMGQRVDDFMRDIGDLIADEDVTQELLNAKGKIKAKERVQDEYLILHHGYEWGARAEFRMDEKGNRLGPIGLEKGYLVTSGFALSCISFGTATQSQSRFRYLGEERIGSRETYVLGFAQQPGKATFTATMVGTGGTEIDMLTQGILWLDKDSLQIIRMRSDLLAPNHEIRLDQQTTDITFGEMKLPDVPNPLWLPSSVETYMEIAGQKYRNIHHYTKYRRYRVSVKIVAPQ